MNLQGNILTGEHIFAFGTVQVSGEKITSVEIEGEERESHPYISPGFIDQHCHGGGGGSFDSADKDSIQKAIDFHRKSGTTSVMASLVSARQELLLDQVAALVPFFKSGEILGVHLEGPWINPEKKGAHDPDAIRDFDVDELNQILEVGQGAIKMVTIAPEISDSLTGISALKKAGVAVALGHTNAHFDQINVGIEAGGRIATHLFNAMPALGHRDPGPVGAFLSHDQIFVELIADLVHVHPSVLKLTIRSAGVDRTILITDCMCAAGCAPGLYQLGNLDVEVTENRANLFGTNTLAGSVLTLHKAVSNIVEGNIATLAEAVRMASTSSSRALTLDEIGVIETGKQADLVVLNPDMSLQSVIRKGTTVV